jgi:hypothetical protein
MVLSLARRSCLPSLGERTILKGEPDFNFESARSASLGHELLPNGFTSNQKGRPDRPDALCFLAIGW